MQRIERSSRRRPRRLGGRGSTRPTDDAIGNWSWRSTNERPVNGSLSPRRRRPPPSDSPRLYADKHEEKMIKKKRAHSPHRKKEYTKTKKKERKKSFKKIRKPRSPDRHMWRVCNCCICVCVCVCGSISVDRTTAIVRGCSRVSTPASGCDRPRGQSFQPVSPSIEAHTY